MKWEYFWLLLLPASIWSITLFHKRFALTLHTWYSFALIITYITIVGIVMAVVVNKLVTGLIERKEKIK